MSNILANNINARSGNTITIGKAGDKVSVAGSLSYEDVSSVDSVGVITARSGIHVTGGSVGIGTDNPTERLHLISGSSSSAGAQVDIMRLVASDFSPTNSGGLTIGAVWHNTDVSRRISYLQSSQNINSGSTNRALCLNPNGGTIGVGTDDPNRLLHLQAASSTAYSGGSDTADYNFLKIENTTDDRSAGVFFLIGSNGEAAITATEVSDGATDITFQNRGGGVRSEKVRIDSSGRVGINTTGFADTATALNIKNGASGSEHTFLDIECNANESCRVRFSEDGSTYPGEIRYTTLAHELQFYVNSVRRMIIDSSGRIGVNTDAFNDAAEAMRVNGPSGQADAMLTIKSNNNGTGNSILNFGDDDFNEGRIRYDHSNNSMDFFVNDAESVSIDSGNNVYMGDPADYGNSNYGQTSGNGNFLFRRDTGSNGGAVIITNDADNGWSNMYLNKFDWNTSDDSRFINFFKNGSSVSAIELNADGTQVVYNTGSDYRLKENVVSITNAISRVKQLQPKSFNYIADENDNSIDGFLAHEASTVVPYAVTGTHNGTKVDEEGNTVPDMQGMDYGKLTPLLTAALQEAISEIETLKTKVAALEGN